MGILGVLITAARFWRSATCNLDECGNYNICAPKGNSLKLPGGSLVYIVAIFVFPLHVYIYVGVPHAKIKRLLARLCCVPCRAFFGKRKKKLAERGRRRSTTIVGTVSPAPQLSLPQLSQPQLSQPQISQLSQPQLSQLSQPRLPQPQLSQPQLQHQQTSPMRMLPSPIRMMLPVRLQLHRVKEEVVKEEVSVGRSDDAKH
uniref:Uncharacterized protein n=2 Tax=Lotharella globosa TaxID=91324 RepID=A0A7S3Z0E9_9EUKA